MGQRNRTAAMNAAAPAKPHKRAKSPLLRRIPLELCLVLILVAALFAFYGVQNFRGHRAWKQYVSAVRSRGESLAVPAFTPEFQTRIQASESTASELARMASAFDGMNQHIRTFYFPTDKVTLPDFVSWAQHLADVKSGKTTQPPRLARRNPDPAAQAAAAAVLLDILAEHDPLVEEIRTACRRPELIYPFGYDSSGEAASPRIFEATRVCYYLRLKVCTELATGRTAAALDDLELMFYLSDSLRQDHFLVAQIGSVHCRSMALSSLWFGFAERRFTESDLVRLQKLLTYIDPISDFRCAALDERNRTLEILEEVRRTGNYAWITGDRSGWLLRLLPDGWMQLEKGNLGGLIDEYLGVAFEDWPAAIHLTASSNEITSRKVELEQTPGLLALWNGTIFTTMLMPLLWDNATRAASARVLTDQIVMACALERYYLKHQRYPDRLEQIVPEFLSELPKDPLCGSPYGYAQRNERYRIWSVGPDENNQDGQSDDWLWHYPDL